ncbi:MAG TPA: ATP-binding protein [Candidatus Limnocylindria bacterium]|nr:ATP-binding protein [Candidatus Limnocylindria bacterium]
MFIHSIRWRLLLWFGILLVVVLAGFGTTAYQLQRINRFHQIDQDLERRVGALSADARIGPPGRGPGGPGGPGHTSPDGETRRREPGHDEGHHGDWTTRPPDESDRPGLGPGGGSTRPWERPIRLSQSTKDLFDSTSGEVYYFAIWTRDGPLLKGSTNLPTGISMPSRPGRETTMRTRTRGDLREAFHYSEMGECILVGRSIASDLESLERTRLWLGAVGLGILVFSLGGAFALANQALRPVDRISAAATRISGGNLEERIEVNTHSELGQLAEVLNGTFARLEAAFRQQKQFTADASHELRTPLAVIIAEAQSTLARPRSESEYRETIETCLDAAQEMRRLTESLLQLARLDAAEETLVTIPLPLGELVRDCVDMIQPLAVAQGLDITAEISDVTVEADRLRLRQVIINILGNALHYNKPQGSIQVSLMVDEGKARLSVRDTGQGISAEDLPHIFERFYRGDKARSNQEGRSGLGLAISKAIITAHQGTIEATSELGVGTEIIVRLPAAPTSTQLR